MRRVEVAERIGDAVDPGAHEPAVEPLEVLLRHGDAIEDEVVTPAGVAAHAHGRPAPRELQRGRDTRGEVPDAADHLDRVLRGAAVLVGPLPPPRLRPSQGCDGKRERLGRGREGTGGRAAVAGGSWQAAAGTLEVAGRVAAGKRRGRWRPRSVEN
jgi:hypothetical protein